MATGDPSESLKCKVSIHCEGCWKKVHKILKRIQGVYDIEIDAGQHKVTVKATVNPETLIKKLEKSGKHAELWPEKKPRNQNPTHGHTSNKKERKATSKPKESSVNSEEKPILSGSGSSSASTPTAVPASKPSYANKTEAQTNPPTEPSKTNSKTEESTTKVLQTSDGNKASASGDASVDNGVGKKKGKKDQKESSEYPAKKLDVESTDLPPPQHMYPYPTYPPPPAYIPSYDMAQPSVSQAYYSSPVSPASQGFVYMSYPPPPFYHGPLDPNSPASMQPPQHGNMFSDENLNACNLM